MPLYDFICLGCNQRFDIHLSYSEYGKKTVACPHCGSKKVKRRVPRVRMKKSEESRLESLADPSALAGLEDDPKSLGRSSLADPSALAGWRTIPNRLVG